MARRKRLKTDAKPIDRIEHAHEKQFESDYEDLSTATLCVREVNISDGVLTGGLCGEAHKLQAAAHYFACSKHRHPTDRWESFPNTRLGWEMTESRIRSAIEFRTFKLRGMNEALKLANERVLEFAPNPLGKLLHSPQK